jgi:hypothetical protein
MHVKCILNKRERSIEMQTSLKDISHSIMPCNEEYLCGKLTQMGWHRSSMSGLYSEGVAFIFQPGTGYCD